MAHIATSDRSELSKDKIPSTRVTEYYAVNNLFIPVMKRMVARYRCFYFSADSGGDIQDSFESWAATAGEMSVLRKLEGLDEQGWFELTITAAEYSSSIAASYDPEHDQLSLEVKH